MKKIGKTMNPTQYNLCINTEDHPKKGMLWQKISLV